MLRVVFLRYAAFWSAFSLRILQLPEDSDMILYINLFARSVHYAGNRNESAEFQSP